MKKYIFLAIALIASIGSEACTNVIVGKKASADGSVMVSYNADSYGMYGNIHWNKGGQHQAGEMRKIYDWDTNKYLGEIPQVTQTYNVVAQMNEYQVSICETTFGGREELFGGDGVIDYGSLIYIALERSKTAQEALTVMTTLAEQYGYVSEGETFSIADKNEVWIMEMVGMGKGNKGCVWAAVRVPDDCVSAHANQSRITKLSQYDKKQVMYSKNCIKFAREKGYFTGKDKDFSFRDAYAPNDFSAVRYCDTRVWSIFNRLCDGMDQYVEYAKGNDLKGEMPLYMKPKQPVTVKDVMGCMRDHYEGTPFDIQNELGAGPYNMPYRPTPLSFTVDGKKYFNERPVSTQQTGFCFVGQMRSDLPDAIGGIAWVTNDDSNMAPFVPLFCSTTEMPPCFIRVNGKQDDATFSWESAYWVQNTVANMVYPYYSKMFPDLLRYREKVEMALFKLVSINQKKLAVAQNDSVEAYTKKATSTSTLAAKLMMATWTELFKYLVVKHNDMAVKKVGADDRFLKTEDGLIQEVERPGYPVDFARKTIQPENCKKSYVYPEEKKE